MKYIKLERFKNMLDQDSVTLTDDLYIKSKSIFSDTFLFKYIRHFYSQSIIKQTFSGSIEGNGHTVSLPYPLFYEIASESSLKNIQFEFRSTISKNFIAEVNHGKLQNISVSGDLSVSSETIDRDYGGLVGTNYHVLEDCSFSGTIKTFQDSGDSTLYRHTGGIVGHNKGKVSSCSVSGEVIGPIHIGGIAGQNSSEIKNCVCSDVTVVGLDGIGGIVGRNMKKVFNCTVKDSTIRGDFYTGETMQNSMIGGIVGFNSVDTSISNCELCDSTIKGDWKVGGVGGINRGTVEQCEVDSESSIDGIDVIGGCIGSSEYDSTVNRCLIEASCSGIKNFGGVAGKLKGTSVCENIIFTSDCSIGHNSRSGTLFGSISETANISNCYYNGSNADARLVGETAQDIKGLYNVSSKDLQEVLCLAGI